MSSKPFRSETGNGSGKEHQETFDVLSVDHPETLEERASYCFPAPIDSICNLDAFAEEHPLQKPVDTVPQWVQHLTQSEANRFLQACDDRKRRDVAFESFLETTTYYAQHTTERNRLLKLLSCQDVTQTMGLLREWLKRHSLDDCVQENGVFIQKPGFLRHQEQENLIIPNVRHILKQHFADHPVPFAQRTMMDIGTWDGRIPNSCKDLFSKIIAVEPNEERFGQMVMRASDQFECVNAAMQDLFEYPDIYPFTPDAINMSHVHYFLQEDGADFRSLDWALARLRPGGIGLVTLNDMARVPSSRADLRHHLGVSEKGPKPEEYAQYLRRQNAAVRVMRPTLNFRATTSDGYQAMRDVMRFMLPGETRHDHAAINEYLEEIRREDGTFHHRLFMMAFYKPGARIPEDHDDGHLEEFFLGTRRRRRQQVLAHIPDASEILHPLDINRFERIESFSQFSPQALLDLLAQIAESTDHGLRDGILTQILEHIGISRVIYFEWLTNESRIQEAAQRGDTTLPQFKSLSPRTQKKPRMTKEDRMREMHTRIQSHARDVFPRGYPSSLALQAIGMGHTNGSSRLPEQQWYDLAHSAHEHRSALLERLENTHVAPIRALIGALLSLGEIVSKK